MLYSFSGLCVLGAFGLLAALSVVDFKQSLLPNRLVLGFLLCGLLFHASTGFEFLPPWEMLYGAILGAGSLFLIRAISNWHYKDDTLGLGDVKLMGAAGLWLGSYHILIALIAGAIAGLLHGLVYGIWLFVKTKRWPDFTKMALPAGPGFALGILLAGGFLFQTYPAQIEAQIVSILAKF